MSNDNLDLSGVRAVFFDWNGTLQNDAPITYEASPAAITRHFGLPVIGYDDWRRWPNHHNWEDNYHSLGVPASVTREEMIAVYIGALRILPNAPLFPDALPTLHGLADRGLRLALVSGMPLGPLGVDLSRHGLNTFFELVEGDVRRKDEVLSRLLSETGLSPEETAYVGDISDDAVAAEKVGMRAFIIPRGFQHPDSIDDVLVRLPNSRLLASLADLLQL